MDIIWFYDLEDKSKNINFCSRTQKKHMYPNLFPTATSWAYYNPSKESTYRWQGEQAMSQLVPLYLEIHSDFWKWKNGQLEKSKETKGHTILSVVN